MEQDDKKVRLEFQSGPEVEHDLVIGADGIHSTVAELLDIDHTPPVYSRANIFYGLISNPDEVDFQNTLLARDHVVLQGNCTGEFISFRAGPEDKKVLIWANTYPSDASPPREEWGATDPSSCELTSLLNEFPSAHPVHELESHTDRLLHFGLFYRKHKDVWSKGRTCLLGDSCHATLPYVGQGANQAIEDAIVLAQCLSDYECEQAYEAFYEQRSRRTKRIVRIATIMNKLHHARNPLLVTFRDYVFHAFAKGNLMTRMVEKEIVEECPIKDYAKYK